MPPPSIVTRPSFYGIIVCPKSERDGMDPVSEEQEYVDTAYRRLDTLKAGYSKKLNEIRRHGLRDNPEQTFQRDSFAADFEDNIARLSNVEHQLVLGRLDSTSGEASHIGRIGLRDEDRNVLLLDWRAPQASAFYRATALNPLGMVRRRHIQTRLRQVMSVEDELLTSNPEDADGLTLTGEGALLASLGRARDGKMGDIVATIQAEQDRIIRESTDGILVVQGGPGTGKTAVALHRAAYLLYAERARLARSGVLIIGPSTSFLTYISTVLPSLGESDVVSSTIEDLIPGIRASASDRPEVAAAKAVPAWADVAKRAVAHLARPLRTDVRLRINSHTVTLTPTMVDRAQKRARQTDLPHNEARSTYATSVLDALESEYLRVSESEPQDWIRADIASTPAVRRAVNLHWLPATPVWLLDHLYAHPGLLADVGAGLTAEQRRLVARPRGSQITTSDIPILDELAELLGEITMEERGGRELESYARDTLENMGLGDGIVTGSMLAQRHTETHAGSLSLAERAAADRTWVYGHVVVDEAQELSPMAWRMISRRCPARSMTVVGDLDQHRNGAPAGGWAGLLGGVAESIREEVLTISYRTPASVLDEAEQVMSGLGITLRHPAQAVRDVEDAVREATTLEEALERENDFLDRSYGQGRGTIAIIADNPPSVDDPRVSSLTPTQAKGLEFDSVILAGPIEAPGDLYVAMTRPTQHLTRIKDQR